MFGTAIVDSALGGSNIINLDKHEQFNKNTNPLARNQEMLSLGIVSEPTFLLKRGYLESM